MVGLRLHVICDPVSGIPTVYKDHKTFSQKTSTHAFSGRVLGISEEAYNDTELDNAGRAHFIPLLLAQEKVDSLVSTYNDALHECLERQIKQLDRDGQLSKDGVVVEMDAWLRRIMGECSGKALFGETWPTDDKFYEDYNTFDEGVYPILKKYPSFLIRKSIEARERIYARLIKIFNQPLIRPGELIVERIKVRCTVKYG